jgi:DNA replication protein DnaC
MNGKTHDLLQSMNLLGMSAVLEEQIALAEKDGLGPREVIQRLVSAEFHYRQERSLLYRIKRAGMPWPWTLSSFPFEKQPAVNKSQIMSLAELSFLERAENVIFIGEPGTGKTGLAVGLLRQALVSGHRGRFYNAQDLLDELYASLADRTNPKLIKSLARYDLLVIDELGYLTINSEQANSFFKLMEQRYGRHSTIITTNLDYTQWYDLFPRKTLVEALLDRLNHHCITIRIKGRSLRVPEEEPEKNKRTPSGGSEPGIQEKTPNENRTPAHRLPRGNLRLRERQGFPLRSNERLRRP